MESIKSEIENAARRKVWSFSRFKFWHWFPFGFVFSGLVIGLLAGFVYYDSNLVMIDYRAWDTALIVCFAGLPAIGLFVGLILDVLIRDSRRRSRVLEWLWISTIIIAFLYLAFGQPVQVVRE